MPEYIRALIVILGLASVVFAFAKSPATALAISKADFLNRRNAWLLITLAGFLSQNYWIFVALVIVVVSSAAKKDSNKIALFFFIALALPQINVDIPGFAGIRYFLSINYVQILSIILLFPMCLAARKSNLLNRSRLFAVDKILVMYILLNLILQSRYDSPTVVARSVMNWVVDVIIPYYAISRSVKSLQDFRDIFMSFSIAAMLASVVAIFEFSRRWLLYASAGNALGVTFDPGYLARSDYLRALATSGQPIVLGCVISVAIGLYAGIYRQVPDRKKYWLGFALLAGGLLAPLSKGAWVGAFTFGLIFLLTGPNVVSRFFKIIGVILISILILALTGFGQGIISFMPFIGTVDSDNFTYRQLLLDISLRIILDNPFFGSTDYLLYMEELRQGEGIIDLVNTYIIVGLNTGLIGLSLYILFFTVIGVKVIAQMNRLRLHADYHLIGRAILGAFVAILLMISSVSPIYHIPLVLWCLAALALSYSNIDNNELPRVT